MTADEVERTLAEMKQSVMDTTRVLMVCYGGDVKKMQNRMIEWMKEGIHWYVVVDKQRLEKEQSGAEIEGE